MSFPVIWCLFTVFKKYVKNLLLSNSVNLHFFASYMKTVKNNSKISFFSAAYSCFTLKAKAIHKQINRDIFPSEHKVHSVLMFKGIVANHSKRCFFSDLENITGDQRINHSYNRICNREKSSGVWWNITSTSTIVVVHIRF